jgi:hypothetical protein
MYLIVIAWIYVVLMMGIAEAASSNGTLLGALMTFVLYGVGPVLLVVYLMGAPARGRVIKKRETAAREHYLAARQSRAVSIEPDAGSHAPGGVEAVAIDTRVAPVRKEP